MTLKLRYYIHANTGLDEQCTEKALKCFKSRKVKKGEYLLAEGEVCGELYFIHSGCMRTYYTTAEGHEKTRYIAFENSIVTSFSSFISQQPSLECIDALEDSELYAISHKDFYGLMPDLPQWEKFYRLLLERAYLFQNRRIEDLVTLSAKQRYQNLMAENPKYIQRLSNKILASYLDITQETLSRIKSK